MVIFASEDIGNADVESAPVGHKHSKPPKPLECQRLESFWDSVAIFSASAPKSNRLSLESTRPSHFFKNRSPACSNAHWKSLPVGYEYPHDFPNFITGQSHWPETMSAQQFYKPTDSWRRESHPCSTSLVGTAAQGLLNKIVPLGRCTLQALTGHSTVCKMESFSFPLDRCSNFIPPNTRSTEYDSLIKLVYSKPTSKPPFANPKN